MNATDTEYLNREQEGDEYLMMGLRLREGIDLERYERLAGRKVNEQRLLQLFEDKLLEPVNATTIRATPEGALLLNSLVADLAL